MTTLTAASFIASLEAKSRMIEAEKAVLEQQARVLAAQAALLNHQANEARDLADSLKTQMAQQEAAIIASHEQMLRDKAAHEAGVGVTRKKKLLDELFERASALSEIDLEALLQTCGDLEAFNKVHC